MLPKARGKQLTIEELPDETLVFDHQNGKAHCLNRASRLVWKHCDGRTTLAQLAALVRKQLGFNHAEAVVELALEQLGQRNLLEEAVARPSAERRRTRRDLLKKIAVAVALPVVMTVAAPRASAIGSLACETNNDCDLFTLNFGCILGVCVNFKCTTIQRPLEFPCTVGTTLGSCINGQCVAAPRGNSSVT